jgi:ABC-2 type transport system permease protein
MHFKLNDYRVFLGFLWSFVGPLVTFCVLYVIFSDSFGKQIPMFGLKLFVGVFVLNFFLSVVRITMGAVFGICDLALNNRIPHAILLVAPLSIPLLKFAVEILLCLLIAVGCGTLTWSSVPQILVFTALFLVFSFGTGLCLGLLNGLAADIGEIWQRITPLFYFITPLFYDLETVTGIGKRLMSHLNPVTVFVLAYQHAIVGTNAYPLNGFMVFQMISYAGTMLIASIVMFKKMYPEILEK